MRRAIYIGCSFAFKPLCSLVVLRALAGSFGEEGFGYLTQYMAFLAVVFGLSLGGASNYLIKNLSQTSRVVACEKEVSVVFSYGFLFLCLLAICFVFLKGSLEEFIFYRSVSWWVIFYILIVFFISNVCGILMAVALAQGKTNRYVLANIGGAALFVLIVVCLVLVGAEDGIYWALPLSYILPVVFLYRTFEGKIRLDFKLLWANRRLVQVFRFCLIVYVGLVSIPVISILVRESFHQQFGAVELSYWQVAVKISDTVQQFYGMFCSAILLPYLSRKIGDFHFSGWFKKLLGVSGVYFLGALIIFSFREYFVSLLFGEGYSSAKNYVSYYLIGDYFRVCALFCSFTLISADRFGRALIFEFLQGLLFVSLFYYFSMGNNSIDVGYAYILTYSICFLVMLGFVFNYFNGRRI
ncbi:hypothetical protein D3879_25925 [Pseudomonas cavernicola]|uniref:Polysaccharide biosynthesis protein n=1 Tax=Pseudomonas cavernicola TaxID=2320866 RepID=A0A418X9R3_9PSED|nr:hypothetical protein D3879_25925 [Pseudomonas cavernicola]